MIMNQKIIFVIGFIAGMIVGITGISMNIFL